MSDQQMAELYQERLERTLETLRRVALGISTYDDAEFLARELGVGQFWIQPKKEERDGQVR